MGWIGDLWDGFKDLFGMGSTAAQIQSEQNIANMNYQAQQDLLNFQKQSYQQNYDYQKALQKQLFEREDNAVSRRALDMQKAGLSKTLAAGGGAGAGSVVGTSAFTSGSAPKMDVVDRAGRVLQLMQAQADMRKTEAEAVESLKRGETLDSQILNDELSRDYTRIKMAIANGNLDMLGLTKQQKQSSINHTNAMIREIDERILASQQNRKINDYKLSNLLPAEYNQTIEQIANLKKQGRIYEADVIYRNLQSDLLTQNINLALFNSKISELDYYYQANTGLKPRSASPVLGDVMGAVNSSGYSSYLDFIKGLGDKAVDAYKHIVASFRDNTPK